MMSDHPSFAQLHIRQGVVPTEFAPQDNPTPDMAGFTQADLHLIGDQISRVGAVTVAGASAILDATGCYVLPGFIDVHVHGGAGYDTMDGSVEGLATMANFFAQHGVTGFLATTMTAPHQEILHAVAAVGQWEPQASNGARLLGLHVEGPYISLKFPGAQPAAYIRPPSLPEFAELLRRIIPWLLAAVAVYTALNRRFGLRQTRARLDPLRFALLFGCGLGFYDGVFGPGTGSFWTVALVTLLGLELRDATGYTKAVNLASNLGALGFFLWHGAVHFPAGAVMVAGQLLGARLGSGLVVRRGSAFIRPIFLAVVFALTLRLLWQAWAG